LAHVKPEDLQHDSLGAGDRESDMPVLAAVERERDGRQAVMALASNGYLRSNLYVLNREGALAATGTLGMTEAAMAGAPAAAMEGAAVAPGRRLERIREARVKGYEGDACGECGNFTLVRNGTCLKCDTCGATSGCS
jgi:ribonucleoside-diphosphate reductase alpha chain